VGVAFYVMLALRARLRETGWFGARRLREPRLAELLDLVALGTVADLVPLDHNNRILVARGLARINAGVACAGVRALLAVAGRKPARASTTDLGFFVAPRLNAAGRLTDMSLGIECLITDDEGRARDLAAQLDALNRERRTLEADMQNQALRALEGLRLDTAGLPKGLCLFDESWHQGVIGLVASRIKERVHRPVIAFAPGAGTELKGSARSIPGLHIRDTLDAIAARHPQLLQKFGGHAMAAGLSLAREHLDGFRVAFETEVGRQLCDDDLQGRVWSDGELGADDLTLELAEELRAAAPWGQGFPEPVFDGEFEVVSQRVVGDKHIKLALRAGGRVVDAIAFHAAPHGQPIAAGRVRAAYRLDVNEYQGVRALQLVLEHVTALD
jgi:single-stranded-DNA-specific exonuclease